ncbi:MAG: gamma-glutamyltranspeptidase [Acidobacteria bacterium]|nr:gamma-glutamyltranspeptidase [Acidobacteriota bacterium]
MLSRLTLRLGSAAVTAALIGPWAWAQNAERLKQQRESLQWQVIRPVVRGDKAAVAAGTPIVTEAAMRMLHEGGNAVDAGVASLFTGAVTEFSHFGFGGEAPILIRTPDGKTLSIAGVGTAPQLMTREYFLSRRTNPELEQESQRRGREQGPIPSYGILPALVPGMVDAGLLALKQFGTKSFAEIAEPAAQAADGFPIDEMRARSIASATRFLRRFPTSRQVFLGNGMIPQPGDVFRQPDLARTIRSMIEAERKALAAGKSREQAIDAVRDHFYRGDIARRIGEFVKANDGLLRYEDMAAFRLEVEEPLTTTFMGYEVYKSGFWTQGGVMIEALNILEGFPLTDFGWNSPEYIHTVVEALKLAYADRDTWYADPKFSEIPEKLMTKEYAAERRALIDPAQSSTEFRPGKFGNKPAPHPARYAGQLRPLTDALASKDTTCIDVIDKDGWMFSATPSGAWMPSVIAGDTGVPLTQRAQSFLMIADHPNVVEPGKRPRITLTPTIVTRQGEPMMALSTPGGDQQDQALLQVMLAALLFRFNPEAAVEAPRFQTRHLVASFDDHAMEPNKLLLDERIPESVLEELLDKGHDIERRSRWDSGSAPVALKVLRNGVIEAGADPYGFRYADAW